MKKRVYSAEFKSSAVRLSYERENIKELADELGIQVERIYKWRSSQKTFTNPQPIISKKTETDSLEVKQLRKALKEKELELEILKKAVHIFSKSDGKSTNL